MGEATDKSIINFLCAWNSKGIFFLIMKFRPKNLIQYNTLIKLLQKFVKLYIALFPIQ